VSNEKKPSLNVVYKEPANVGIKGRWKMELTGPGGEQLQTVFGENVVVVNGVSKLAEFLNSANAAASTFTFGYIGIGSDPTAEASTDTALGTQLARHTGIVSYVSAAIYQVVATFIAGLGTGAVVEYGLFNSSANGTLFSRDTESVINKGAGDTLTVTAQYTFSG